MAKVVIKFGSPAVVKSAGKVFVNLGDGTQLEFESATALSDAVSAAVNANSEALRMLAIGHRLAADPLLDSPLLWNGTTVTIDPEQALAANVFKASLAAPV